MTYDNGFNRACPSGNTMIDGWREPKERLCPACEGNGTTNWPSVEDLLEELAHQMWKRKKAGHVDGFREMLKVMRALRKDGMCCAGCDGTGYVEV